LQDQALGYGKDVSRFTEKKRVVEDKDIGPLIETEMTRCIHCTRCVRFGQEVAGVMELGMIGRSEHAEIGTAPGHTVDSEVSGNMVDLCPVGALTNKPYRFTARAWELTSHDGISPHDCVGANTNIQSVTGRVKRILPRDNEAVNQCWLSDRDRYSFEALNSPDRLIRPLVRRNGEWHEADWESALTQAVSGLKTVIQSHGPDQLGALAAPTSTMEEFYLLQKLMRALGSHNVDHRLRQQDFRDDDKAFLRPWLGCSIEELDAAGTIFLVGSNIRKEQPLLGLRVRNAALKGATIVAINPMDYAFNFDLAQRIIAAPADLPNRLAAVVSAVYDGTAVPPEVAAWVDDANDGIATDIGRVLSDAGADAVIILGSAAAGHAEASVLRALVQALSRKTGARWGCLSDGNGAAAWVSGCVPHGGSNGTAVANAAAGNQGSNAADMIRSPRKGYLLLGVEPGLDCSDGHGATAAMTAADCVVALSVYDIREHTDADVLLPVTPYSETSGSYVNCEGRLQSVSGAVAPLGQARPAWKVLRVLGNMFESAGFNAQGFDYITSEDVKNEIAWSQTVDLNDVPDLDVPAPDDARSAGDGLQRIGDVPLYRTDALVRRAGALQSTRDNPPAAARLCLAQARQLGVGDGDRVRITASAATVSLPVRMDEAVPAGCVFIPAGYPATVPLGNSASVKVSKE
jgi:NADH-quinone oxidoreductase subunit G